VSSRVAQHSNGGEKRGTSPGARPRSRGCGVIVILWIPPNTPATRPARCISVCSGKSFLRFFLSFFPCSRLPRLMPCLQLVRVNDYLWRTRSKRGGKLASIPNEISMKGCVAGFSSPSERNLAENTIKAGIESIRPFTNYRIEQSLFSYVNSYATMCDVTYTACWNDVTVQ
jgi:hypothetical protein